VEAVQSLSEGTDGALWATTQNGLLIYRKNGRWNTFSNFAGTATCVTADRSGAIWVGTRNHQLWRLANGTWRVWDRTNGLAGQTVHSLLATTNGDLWIDGGAEFVQRWRSEKIEGFKIPTNAGTVRAMAEDRTGNVWLGTARGYLLRFNGETVTDETA